MQLKNIISLFYGLQWVENTLEKLNEKQVDKNYRKYFN